MAQMRRWGETSPFDVWNAKGLWKFTFQVDMSSHMVHCAIPILTFELWMLVKPPVPGSGCKLYIFGGKQRWFGGFSAGERTFFFGVMSQHRWECQSQEIPWKPKKSTLTGLKLFARTRLTQQKNRLVDVYKRAVGARVLCVKYVPTCRSPARPQLGIHPRQGRSRIGSSNDI